MVSQQGQSLDEAFDIIKNWKINEILNAYLDAPKKGLNTEISGKSILYWSKIFLNLSKGGLLLRNQLNQKGNNEAFFLKNIENILKKNKTKAEQTLDSLN